MYMLSTKKAKGAGKPVSPIEIDILFGVCEGECRMSARKAAYPFEGKD